MHNFGILFIIRGAIILLAMFVLNGCKKDAKEMATVHFFLTDAPAPFQEVKIDFNSLEFLIEGYEAEIFEFEKDRTIDMLNYTNGRDTMLGTLLLNPGVLLNINIFIGQNNKVKLNNENVSVSYPGSNSSGVSIFIGDTLKAGQEYNYWVDFDAYRSVAKIGENFFILRPVCRVFEKEKCGSIVGEIIPATIRPYIQAISETDTLGAIAGENGKFRMLGAPAGIYTLKIFPQSTTSNTLEIKNVTVVIGKTTDAGRIFIF